MTDYCDYTGSVNKLIMGPTGAQLRYRNGFNSAGQGTFDPGEARLINQGFYNAADAWGQSFSDYCAAWNGDAQHPVNAGWHVDWWGHVGIFGHCDSSTPSWHHTGRALDLARVQFVNGEFMDSNWSWQAARLIKYRRRYLAVAAMLRRNFDTVITFGFNSAHHDHIHLDNGDTLHPIDDSTTTDTLIVQMACNWLNDATLNFDGNWGSGTENAFDNLRAALGMNCFNIRNSLPDTKTFLLEVAYRGLLNMHASNTGWCS